MSYSNYGIEIPNNKTSGEVTTICPQCSHTRKKKTDKCLSVNLDKQVWHCNHCGFKGYIKPDKNIVYKVPEWKNKTDLDEKTVKWFESRKISQGTLKRMQVTDGIEWMPKAQKEILTIQFNYFRDGQLVNVKYRGKDKDFKLHKDAELIFYNLDAIKDVDDVFIVEGEMDALTFVEAGILNVVSVPNGATLQNNNLQYITNCFEQLEGKRFILALDNDTAGRNLRSALTQRLGIENCLYLEFEDCKDANEYLIKNDINKFRTAVTQAKQFPLEGAFTITDISDDIYDLYVNGLDKGVNTHIPNFNLRFVKGYITTITGIPSHGKSDFLDYICLSLHRQAGWKGAFYSPENKPTQLHFSKMARKILGKNWIGDNKMTWEEVAKVGTYLDQEVWFIKPEKDFTIDSILSSVKQLKTRFGLDYFVIDAWNKLEHKYTDSETKYIGETLDKIAVFCEVEQVHCFIVAHPTKMRKQKDSLVYDSPTLYDISGSSNFYNKTDNGISVYRDFESNKTFVNVLKVKFSHWGEVSTAEFCYDVETGRYYPQYQEFYKTEQWIK